MYSTLVFHILLYYDKCNSEHKKKNDKRYLRFCSLKTNDRKDNQMYISNRVTSLYNSSDTIL